MKRISKMFFLMFAVLLFQNGFAQTIELPPEGNYDIGVENYAHNQALLDYYQKMQVFILDKSAEPMPTELKELIRVAQADHGEFSKPDVAAAIRDYWKFVYIANNPQPDVSYSVRASDGTICDNGGFENDFDGYRRFRSTYNDHFPKCDPKKGGQPLIWEYLIPNPVTYPLDYPFDLKIVNQGLDPNIPAVFDFNQVRFGESALMINEIVAGPNGVCGYGGFGINKITKEFVVDEEHERFAVWYATVLQDPNGHIGEHFNDKPFFNIQFFDKENNLVDELCWDSTEDFFINHPTRRTSCGNESNVRFQPWTCTIFDFRGYTGMDLRMEITAADCGKGAHFGYAYVDGICDYCATIEIAAEPVECADLPYQVTGNVTILDSGVSNLGTVSLEGVLVGDDGSEVRWNINNNPVTGDFVTSITAAHLNPGVCYDFYVEGTFQNGTDDPFMVRSATLIQGDFNDFCTEDFSNGSLDYTYTVECIDIGHPNNITNDQYRITFNVITSGPDVAWEIIRSGWDVIASGTGSQTVIIGPYRYQECDYFELRDVNCDKTCFIDIKYDCGGCVNAFRICDHEIICDDNGTPGFFEDDLWSIRWVVESDNPGNWAVSNPGVVGNYNQVTTIFMGELENYGATHTFKVYDPNTRCILRYDVDLPRGCKNCLNPYEARVSDCKEDDKGNDIFYVELLAPPGIGDCISGVYLDIGNNDYLPIPYLTANGANIVLGPFYVNAGPFTLMIEDCYGCRYEVVVFPPYCGPKPLIGSGNERSVESEGKDIFQAFPNPTSNQLNLKIADFDTEYNIHVVNMFGQNVMQLNGVLGDQNLDLSSLSAGVYHLVISDQSKVVWTERIVKI